MNEFRLRVADRTLSLVFDHERDARAIARYFRRRSSSAPADIQLAIHYHATAPLSAPVPSSLYLTKEGGGDGFSMAGGLIRGRYSPSSGEGELLVDRLIVRGGYARIFEQALYQAFWSALRRAGADTVLLHSSGVLRDDRAYVFTGPSGSGKSTVARLSRRYAILNDEITAIALGEPRPRVHDTPFNGFNRSKKEGSGSAAGIFVLAQAARHRIRAAADSEHILALSREVIPPMGLETPLTPAVYMEMLSCAQRIGERVMLYRMEFLPDRGFWTEIDKELKNDD